MPRHLAKILVKRVLVLVCRHVDDLEMLSAVGRSKVREEFDEERRESSVRTPTGRKVEADNFARLGQHIHRHQLARSVDDFAAERFSDRWHYGFFIKYSTSNCDIAQ